MNKVVVLWMVILGIPLLGNAQSDPDDLRGYLEGVRAGNLSAATKYIVSDESLAKSYLEVAEDYYADSTLAVRTAAYDIAKLIGLKNTNSIIRERVVTSLSAGLDDTNGGLIARNTSALMRFNKGDFTDEAISNVQSHIQVNQQHLDKIILLVGFIGGQNSLDDLDKTELKRKTLWSYYLASARLGDESAMQRVLDRIKSLPLNDDVVEELLPDLIYTHQKSALDYIVELLNETTPYCESTDADNDDKIVCGYRIMEYLAPVVSDFPLEVGPSGELVTNDYPQALNTVRAWFSANPSFNIKNDTF